MFEMDIIGFLVFLVALIVTVAVHEASHALAAYYLGDPTAKHQGRLTLNPIAHLDMIGSIVFLVTMRIGWGKPVPVNPNNFKHPIRDNALTALAGPASNFIFAFFLAFPIKYLGGYMPDALLAFFWALFQLNVVLGIFNLFPFPPLDGSKILGLFVPKRWHRQYLTYLDEGLKYFVVIILVDAFILRDFLGFSFFARTIGVLYEGVSYVLLLGS